MNTYVILLRGVNVGGKNKVRMLNLQACLEEVGYSNVLTYIASGNVIVESDRSVGVIQAQVEQTLLENFKLDSERIKVLVLTRAQMQAVIDDKPAGFGDYPDTYHSDVIFLMGLDITQAVVVFDPKQGVDTVWAGHGVIYSQRLSALRTKSRLGIIVGTSAYKSMTIRNWNTTTKLLEILGELSSKVK